MITRVGVRNFKAFKDEALDLSMLNLFTGLNGMGKSTFIQALLLLRQSSAADLNASRGLILKGGDNGVLDVGKGKDIYSINADTDFISFEIDVDNEPFLSIDYNYEAESDILSIHDCKATTNAENNFTALFSDRFTYLRAERIMPAHYYKANLSDVIQRNAIGYRGENVPLYIALKKFDPVRVAEIQHKNAKANTLIANIDAWMNDIVPGARVVSTYYNELDVVRLGYQFEYGAEVTPEFSPVNVGFGFTYILPVITAVLAARKGDLIIIENPEAHLHPQGQARLGQLFALAATGGVQLIIESHSDHIFNGMRVAVKQKMIAANDVSIFYFERDETADEHITTVSQPIIDNDGRISHKPHGFFDEYARLLDQIIN